MKSRFAWELGDVRIVRHPVKKMHPTLGFGLQLGPLFVSKSGRIHEVKYNPDQPRDSHGRFGEGGTTSSIDEAALIKYFGLTDNIDEAGYLTPSGKLLDFSGRHQSSNSDDLGEGHSEYRWNPETQRHEPTGKDWLSGQRNVDHRELLDVVQPLTDPHYGDSPNLRMRAMQQAGYVRLSPLDETYLAEITQPMNEEQIQALAAKIPPGSEFGIAVVDYIQPSQQYFGGASTIFDEMAKPAASSTRSEAIGLFRQASRAAARANKASVWFHPSLGWGTKDGAAFVDARGVVHEVKYSPDQPRDYHGRFGDNEAAARDTAYTLEGMARANVGVGKKFDTADEASAYANQLYGQHAPAGRYRDGLEVRFEGDANESGAARVAEGSAVHPVITLGENMRDQLTAIHEVAHIVANEREQGLGRWAASHGNAFQDVWSKMLTAELPQHHELIFRAGAKYAPGQPRDDHGRFGEGQLTRFEGDDQRIAFAQRLSEAYPETLAPAEYNAMKETSERQIGVDEIDPSADPAAVISPAESAASAIEMYSMAPTWEMNRLLREGIPLSTLGEGAEWDSEKAMDDAFLMGSVETEKDTTVFRGAAMTPPEVGTVYHDEAWLSTSTQPQWAVNSTEAGYQKGLRETMGFPMENPGEASVLWAIRIPAGTDVLPISNAGMPSRDREGYEIALHRGADLRVDSMRTDSSGVRVVEATYLGSKPNHAWDGGMAAVTVSRKAPKAKVPPGDAWRVLWMPGDLTVAAKARKGVIWSTKYNEGEARDEAGRWTATGDARDRMVAQQHERDFEQQAQQDLIDRGMAREITAQEARGNSRAVSPEEFQRLAAEGRQRLDAMRQGATPPAGLDRNWDTIKQTAFEETRKSWGGLTVDAHTGQPLVGTEDKYALTVKDPDQRMISVAETASYDQFAGAMEAARSRFEDQLSQRDHYLGVFHDDDHHRIDIDPVIIVSTPREVETIGAYTHATGGAYHFASGDGYWPPHVSAGGKMATRTEHFGGVARWHAQAVATQEIETEMKTVEDLEVKYSPDQPRDDHGRFGFASGQGTHEEIQRPTPYKTPKGRERGLALQQANLQAKLDQYGITNEEVLANLDKQWIPGSKGNAEGMVWYANAGQQAVDAITVLKGPDGKNYTPEQAIAMVAATSPLNAWDQTPATGEHAGEKVYPNLNVAAAAAQIVTDNPEIVVSKEDSARLGNPKWDSAIEPGTYHAADLSSATLSHIVISPGAGLQGLPQGVEKAIDIARGESPDTALSGDKVRDFYTNLVNPEHPSAVTADTWMARVALGTRMSDADLTKFVGQSAGYDYVAERIREGAAAHGVLPQQYQAATWVNARYAAEAEADAARAAKEES